MTDTYLHQWAAHPDGGGLYTDRRDKLLAHDPTCTSLDRAWYPRRGGVVCPSDLGACEDCDVDFFIEGLHPYADRSEDVELCSCCAKKRGLA